MSEGASQGAMRAESGKIPASRAGDSNFRPRDDRRIYMIWVAVMWLLIVIGFSADIGRYFDEVPPPPPILHIHGLASLLWLVLASAQVLLVERGSIRLHKTLGWWLVGLSVLLVPLGFAASFADQARQVSHPDYAPQFLSLEFEEMITFSVMMTLAVLQRKNLAAHKRLMMLAALTMLDAGPGRISDNILHWDVPGYFGWWAHYFWGTALMLPAMMVWDLWKHHRIHPALLWGGAFLAVSEATASFAYYSSAWGEAMVRFIDWWGWTG